MDPRKRVRRRQRKDEKLKRAVADALARRGRRVARAFAEPANSVVKAAHHWWLMKRPADWTREDHVRAPGVNCTTTAERELALAIVKFVKDGLLQEEDTITPPAADADPPWWDD